MKFISTRGKSQVESASHAISKGLADDGGLFVPEYFPSVKDKLNDMLSMSYPEMATFLLKQFLTEYDESALLAACEKAYGLFDDESVVPVVKVDEKLYVQVTESMTNETVRQRELAPLQKINDNYEKIVVSLDTGLDSSYEGIKSVDVIEWLLEN